MSDDNRIFSVSDAKHGEYASLSRVAGDDRAYLLRFHGENPGGINVVEERPAAATMDRLEQFLGETKDDAAPRILAVDLHNVGYMGSDALGILMTAHDRHLGRQETMVLFNVSQGIQDMLGVMRLNFRIDNEHHTAAEVVAAARSGFAQDLVQERRQKPVTHQPGV